MCAVMTTLALAVPAAQAAAKRRCVPPGSHVAAVHGAAVVYRRGVVLYGCLRGVDRRVPLANVFTSIVGSGSAHHFRFSGDLIAFEYESLGKGAQGYVVQVFNLRTGHRLHDAPAGEIDINGVPGTGPVTALVLSPEGDVAWIEATAGVNAPTAPYEVRIVKGRRGTPVLLDRSDGIVATSLRLSGQTLTWLDGGTTGSAQI